MFLAALTATEKQRWFTFWSGDESWIMWANALNGSWITMDEELPQRVHHTIRATKSMLMVFFNPKEFTTVDLLSQDISFMAVYFVNNAILPLANQHAQQLADIGRRMLHLHFDNSKCHTAWDVQEQMTSHQCLRVPRPRIRPTWPLQTSICLAGESNKSPGGLWTMKRTCSKSPLRLLSIHISHNTGPQTEQPGIFSAQILSISSAQVLLIIALL
jgi:hypothetical protein